jgi:putative peptidoglycan lipid II flippase
MWTKTWAFLFGSVFRRGATLLTVLTFGSYVLGLVRDMLFARILGADRLLDIYNAAFVIPDLLLNVFLASALSAAFVPVFSHLLARSQDDDAWRVASTMLVGAPLAMGVLAIPLWFAMPHLASLIAPGFTAAELDQLVHTARLLLLSPILFAVSNTLGSVLISLERFAAYGAAPMLYNAGIIAGIPLSLRWGINGMVFGVLLGALLHLLIRAVALIRSGARLSWPPAFRDRNFLSVLPLMLPRMAGQPVEQIIFSVFTNVASAMGVGSVAVLSFARNFQSVPVSLFGISFSVAIFASLSRKAALHDRGGFLYHLRHTAVALALTTGLSALFIAFFGHKVIELFLGGGRFDAADVQRTGALLAAFAIAIPAESFIHLISRSFYALKDTWTPVLVTIPGLGIIAWCAVRFGPVWGLSSLPIIYGSVLWLEVVVLGLLLWRRVRAW